MDGQTAFKQQRWDILPLVQKELQLRSQLFPTVQSLEAEEQLPPKIKMATNLHKTLEEEAVAYEQLYTQIEK